MLLTTRSVIERQEWVSAIEQLQVRLGGVISATGRQLELFSSVRQGAQERLEAGVRHLSSHCFQLPIYRLVQTDLESRIPERRYALTSYLPDALKPEVRRLREPRPIDVRTDAAGTPSQVCLGDHWRDINVIREEFRVRDEWWGRIIVRRYFKAILIGGRYTVFFFEAGKWLLGI